MMASNWQLFFSMSPRHVKVGSGSGDVINWPPGSGSINQWQRIFGSGNIYESENTAKCLSELTVNSVSVFFPTHEKGTVYCTVYCVWVIVCIVHCTYSNTESSKVIFKHKIISQKWGTPERSSGAPVVSAFRTAHEQLMIDQQTKNRGRHQGGGGGGGHSGPIGHQPTNEITKGGKTHCSLLMSEPQCYYRIE